MAPNGLQVVDGIHLSFVLLNVEEQISGVEVSFGKNRIHKIFVSSNIALDEGKNGFTKIFGDIFRLVYIIFIYFVLKFSFVFSVIPKTFNTRILILLRSFFRLDEVLLRICGQGPQAFNILLLFN